jgi:peroxiredoxin
MRTYLLLLSVLLVFSCNSSEKNQQNNPTKPEALQVNRANNIVERDTTPKPKSNRIIDTSRPKKEIVQAYPFDINLKTADGKILNSEKVLKNNGKPTVLLFWLTTCYPCRIEMAAIEKEYPAWKEQVDFNLFAISTDFEKNFPRFEKMVRESNWPWQAYNDVNREFRKVLPGELNGLPQTFIFDSSGNIAYHKRKYSSGDEQILFEKIKEIAEKR